MAAKKEAAPRKSKGETKKRNTNLRISKAVKVMATMAQLRGGNFRQTIRALGEAEQNWRDNGFLVFQ
jgi:hypothetical protein